MGNPFASAKNSIAECDRCGFQYKLTVLKKLTIKTTQVNIKVCPACWDPDQPQLLLGMYPIDDPQAVRDPRVDNTHLQAGRTGLQLESGSTTALNSDGFPSGGSRVFQWGWYPVGGARSFDSVLTPNFLISTPQIGTVTITIS
jgi:hypothetical protein